MTRIILITYSNKLKFAFTSIVKVLKKIRDFNIYVRNLFLLKRSIEDSEYNSLSKSVYEFGKPCPILNEFRLPADELPIKYLYKTIFVASSIYKIRPTTHLDVSNRIEILVAHLLSFEQKIILGNVRQLRFYHANISYIHIDLAGDIEDELLGRFESISCLHAVSEIGLGRHGGVVDAMGHYTALKNLAKLLAPKGILYLSLPTGKDCRIEYNFQRVISLAECRYMFSLNQLTVQHFACVDDLGNLFRVDKSKNIDWDSSYNLKQGHSIWILQKQCS